MDYAPADTPLPRRDDLRSRICRRYRGWNYEIRSRRIGLTVKRIRYGAPNGRTDRQITGFSSARAADEGAKQYIKRKILLHRKHFQVFERYKDRMVDELVESLKTPPAAAGPII
jgi:hypothetical protein